MIHKSISPQMSAQRHRLITQRSTPAALGRSKFQTPRQSEETMLRQTKPILTRGLGFGGTTISSDGGGNQRLESGTRESSLGELMHAHCALHHVFIKSHALLQILTTHIQHIR